MAISLSVWLFLDMRIGIHGTHLSETVGTRASEGCIRMNNDDLKQLVSLIYPPVTVVITPGPEDERMNAMSASCTVSFTHT